MGHTVRKSGSLLKGMLSLTKQQFGNDKNCSLKHDLPNTCLILDSCSNSIFKE